MCHTLLYLCNLKISVPMKKILIIISLVIASLCFSGCSLFINPANAKKVGCGYVQNDGGLLIVEIDGTKYHPQEVYTGQSHIRSGKGRMEPVLGMQITVFYLRDEKNPSFIAGDQSEERLEEYFTSNSVLGTLIMICCFGLLLWCIIGIIFNEKHPKTIHADL